MAPHVSDSGINMSAESLGMELSTALRLQSHQSPPSTSRSCSTHPLVDENSASSSSIGYGSMSSSQHTDSFEESAPENCGLSFEESGPDSGDCVSAESQENHQQSMESEDGSYQEPVFYFESDHVALKGNRDYQSLLRCVALLEAQRTKAIQDLDSLLECRDSSLQNPVAFVDKLQHGRDVGIPRSQQVTELPTIVWETYTSSIDLLLYQKQPKHMTRHSLKKKDDSGAASSYSNSTPSPRPLSMATPPPLGTLPAVPSSCTSSTTLYPATAACTSSSASSSFCFPSPASVVAACLPRPGAAVLDGGVKDSCVPTPHLSSQPVMVMVRGRMKNESKSDTFNKLWTDEEHTRLEQLLLEYPPEEVEKRRLEKIAKALGNRTAVQVASRVQKYFIKLTRMGLPVPGRMPNVNNCKRKAQHKHQRLNKFLMPQSTFLTSHQPPVFMDDDDMRSSYGSSCGDTMETTPFGSQEDVSDEEDVPLELRYSAEYQEILRLKGLKKKQQQRDSIVQHLGYTCDRCDCEPIIGTRWHCKDCPDQSSIDFCDNCADFVFETEDHKTSHQLEPVHTADKATLEHVDRDYRFNPGTDYNYLDPNYMPAS